MNTREKIYNLIIDNPMTVKEIASKTGLSETAIRAHCQNMVDKKEIDFKIKHLFGNYHHPYALYGGVYKESNDNV